MGGGKNRAAAGRANYRAAVCKPDGGALRPVCDPTPALAAVDGRIEEIRQCGRKSGATPPRAALGAGRARRVLGLLGRLVAPVGRISPCGQYGLWKASRKRGGLGLDSAALHHPARLGRPRQGAPPLPGREIVIEEPMTGRYGSRRWPAPPAFDAERPPGVAATRCLTGKLVVGTRVLSSRYIARGVWPRRRREGRSVRVLLADEVRTRSPGDWRPRGQVKLYHIKKARVFCPSLFSLMTDTFLTDFMSVLHQFSFSATFVACLAARNSFTSLVKFIFFQF